MMRILAALLTLALAACGRGHTAAPDGREFPHVTAAVDRQATSGASDSLEGTSWTLRRVQPADGPAQVPEATATFTVGFEPEGRLQMQADCNRGRGSWRSPSRGSLELGPLVMTRAFCGSRLYDRFVADVGAANAYEIRDGRLSLRANGAQYEFEATTPATAP